MQDDNDLDIDWTGCLRTRENLAANRLSGLIVFAACTVIEAEMLGQSAAETAEDFKLPLKDVLTIRAFYASHAKHSLAT